MIVYNNGKGWLIGIRTDEDHTAWKVYDEYTNRFQSGWGTYYNTKEQAELMKEKIINDRILLAK